MLAPSGKARGFYSCPSHILKCSRDIIAKPLTTLFNVSVQNGRFPSRLEHAKVVPLFKDGDETDPCNIVLYRFSQYLKEFLKRL